MVFVLLSGWFRPCRVYYLSAPAEARSARRRVALHSEQLGQAALGRAHVGEHAAGAGAAFAAVVVEQHGLFDAAQGGQQLAHREVQSGALGFAPMHHWTDSKIRVHVFYCVLALTIAHLMRREAERAGLHLSVRELLATLGGIEETVLLYHDGGKGRPRARRMLTDMSPTQRRLAELFDIQRYAPTR